jgi:hypothetical protein
MHGRSDLLIAWCAQIGTDRAEGTPEISQLQSGWSRTPQSRVMRPGGRMEGELENPVMPQATKNS